MEIFYENFLCYFLQKKDTVFPLAFVCTNNASCSSSDELGKKFWKIRCDSKARGEEFIVTCDYLIIATGHHAKPKIPEFPGQENFAGEMLQLTATLFLCCVHFI